MKKNLQFREGPYSIMVTLTQKRYQAKEYSQLFLSIQVKKELIAEPYLEVELDDNFSLHHFGTLREFFAHLSQNKGRDICSIRNSEVYFEVEDEGII